MRNNIACISFGKECYNLIQDNIPDSNLIRYEIKKDGEFVFGCYDYQDVLHKFFKIISNKLNKI